MTGQKYFTTELKRRMLQSWALYDWNITYQGSKVLCSREERVTVWNDVLMKKVIGFSSVHNLAPRH